MKENNEEQQIKFNELLEKISSNPESDELNISDSSIDALKYALHSLIMNKGSPAGSSNLNPRKIKALSRIKALNHFYRSKAVEDYYLNILELQRSETSMPMSILEIMGNLFKNQPNTQSGIVNRMGSILRGRQ